MIPSAVFPMRRSVRTDTLHAYSYRVQLVHSTDVITQGFHFLYYLEKVVGKSTWDKFIPHYFTTWARKSLTSFDFKATLLDFYSEDAEASKALKSVDWETWFYAPGLPPKPDFDTSLVDECYALADKWANPVRTTCLLC